MDQFLDSAVIIFVLAGALLSLAAGIGLMRFSDVLVRLHAVTKPQVLGLFLILLAIAINERSWVTILAVAPVFIFQALTAPVAAHMVARAAYRAEPEAYEELNVDDLKDQTDSLLLDEELAVSANGQEGGEGIFE